MSKISNWRLSTLEGLNEVLSSTSAAENKNSLTSLLVEKLVAALTMNLKDPPPPGLEGGVSMIVELAVGIASNLPLESRDVFVDYVFPNARIDESIMKLETGLPPLTNPGEGIIEDSMSRSSTDKPDFDNSNNNEIDSLKDNNEDLESPSHNSNSNQAQSQPQPKSESLQAGKKKGGMFGGFMGGKKAGAVPGGSGVQAQKDLAAKELQMGSSAGGKKEEEKTREERVRLCAFMAVEVRGRSVLVKAPVWTHSV